mmetsp:Transcript_50615/g.167699  ORF Transcript_50615/g.167699 Transcript_50615/m.167699 type:complete len:394 (-) Transcript_50615:209-1390(-)
MNLTRAQRNTQIAPLAFHGEPWPGALARGGVAVFSLSLTRESPAKRRVAQRRRLPPCLQERARKLRPRCLRPRPRLLDRTPLGGEERDGAARPGRAARRSGAEGGVEERTQGVLAVGCGGEHHVGAAGRVEPQPVPLSRKGVAQCADVLRARAEVREPRAEPRSLQAGEEGPPRPLEPREGGGRERLGRCVGGRCGGGRCGGGGPVARREDGSVAVEPEEGEASDALPVGVDVQSGEECECGPHRRSRLADQRREEVGANQEADERHGRLLRALLGGHVRQVPTEREVGGDGGARGAGHHAADRGAGGAEGGDEEEALARHRCEHVESEADVVDEVSKQPPLLDVLVEADADERGEEERSTHAEAVAEDPCDRRRHRRSRRLSDARSLEDCAG